MKHKGLSTIFISIILTSILAIALFVITIYALIIPSFEENLMEGKKEMLVELTNTAWSLLNEHHQDFEDSIVTLEQAQEGARNDIEQIRYGDEGKDYFWITDMEPVMIMHPYRKDLNNQSLNDYTDPNGKRLFVEAAALVKKEQQGFFTYMWQWKDDSTKIVDKLSYVKGYEPWGWVIGTGIYIEDVKAEMKTMERKLLRITILVTFLIIIIFLYIIRQSYIIERKRSSAEEDLRISRQKYKSLVEASTEGTLMIVGEEVIFYNKKLAAILDAGDSPLESLKFNEHFKLKWEDIIARLSEENKSLSVETSLIKDNRSTKDVVLTVSKVKFNDQDGYIVIVKDISLSQKLREAGDFLTQDLQLSLMMMNQPIKHFIKPLVKCNLEATVSEAAIMMTKKNQKIIFVEKDDKILGVINDKDIRERFVTKELKTDATVSSIMTAPVQSIPDSVLLYEAMLVFNEKKLSHLAAEDSKGDFIGAISYEDVLNHQRNTLSYILKEIERTESTDQLYRIYQRLPVLVDAMLNSGSKTQNITRIISSVADAITIRVIELVMEDIGPAPCRFAFIAMGSEGRMEQTLATDQDNAIIIENLASGELEKAKSYFLKLGQKVNKDLDYIGYNYCIGNVMAKNPRYCVSLDEWKQTYSQWITRSDPQSVIDASIFFDFRLVYGDDILVLPLRAHVNELIEQYPAFSYHLALSIIDYKTPGDLNSFDVKQVLLPFISFAKIYALKEHLPETNSLKRLDALLQQGAIKQSIYDELILSYNFLMSLRFRFQAKAIFRHENPDNQIDGEQLTDIEKATLKKIFSELSVIKTKLSFDFKGSA